VSLRLCPYDVVSVQRTPRPSQVRLWIIVEIMFPA